MTYPPSDWKPEASRALLEQFSGGMMDRLTRQASCPPVLLLRDGPVVAFHFEDLTKHPRARLLWSWPGQWRNDVFIGRAGDVAKEVREAMGQ